MTVLTVYVVVMIAVPSLARFPPAGSIGAPATMLAILIFFWWLWEQAHRGIPGPSEAQWVRRAAIVLLVAILVVYGVASLRPLPADEVTPAASGVLQFLALVGLTLAAADGIPDLDRLDVLVRRITTAGGWLGALALIQFVTNEIWVDQFLPPFLTMDLGFVGSRSGFARPSATSTHPLEFGAVVAMIIPLAIVRARSATDHQTRHWLRVALLLLCAMMSLSRSALICTAIALLILMWPWSWRDKFRAAVLGLVGVGVVVFAIPGLIGTLRGLFLGSGDDPSIQSRTASYGYVVEMMDRFTWFGKGYGTFLPRYWILDNGFLQFLVSTGVVGMTAFLLLLLAAFYSACFALRVCRKSKDREATQALLAASMAGASAVMFFDIFAFPQAAGLLFLLVGVCGARYRLCSPSSATTTIPSSQTIPSSRRNNGHAYTRHS